MENLVYFILGVIVNLVTPWVVEWVKQRGPNRLKNLQDELQKNTALYESSNRLVASIVMDVVLVISVLGAVMSFGLLSVFIQSVAVQLPSFQYFILFGKVVNTHLELLNLSYTLHQTALNLFFVTLFLLGLFTAFVVRVVNKNRKFVDFDTYTLEMKKKIESLKVKQHPS
ncbi:MAG TPA: hypothetical protein PKL78_14285 [Anaerolineales bacterium]|nr:hypothetical protein [Anaerolineales bacterium]HNO31722.1 hypothetical protein [Anaerolineales bacterium]